MVLRSHLPILPSVRRAKSRRPRTATSGRLPRESSRSCQCDQPKRMQRSLVLGRLLQVPNRPLRLAQTLRVPRRMGLRLHRPSRTNKLIHQKRTQRHHRRPRLQAPHHKRKSPIQNQIRCRCSARALEQRLPQQCKLWRQALARFTLALDRLALSQPPKRERPSKPLRLSGCQQDVVHSFNAFDTRSLI